MQILKTLGLWQISDKIPNQLSGGQQQRTAIGRAVVKNPDILLCDEPTGALDYNTSKEILKLIEEVNQKFGCTVILVTHNDAIRHIADQVVRLRDGQIRSIDETAVKIPALRRVGIACFCGADDTGDTAGVTGAGSGCR